MRSGRPASRGKGGLGQVLQAGDPETQLPAENGALVLVHQRHAAETIQMPTTEQRQGIGGELQRHVTRLIPFEPRAATDGGQRDGDVVRAVWGVPEQVPVKQRVAVQRRV
jgi:hypothetical protein